MEAAESTTLVCLPWRVLTHRCVDGVVDVRLSSDVDDHLDEVGLELVEETRRDRIGQVIAEGVQQMKDTCVPESIVPFGGV